MKISETQPKESRKWLYIFVTILAYFLFSSAIILVNKHILYFLRFPFPIFLSALGVLTSSFASHLAFHLGYVSLQRNVTENLTHWVLKALMIGFMTAISLSLGNAAYLHLDVGFIQMLKSFSPVNLMLVTLISGLGCPTPSTVASVMVISLGTAAACTFSPQFSSIGLSFIAISDVSEAIRLLMTQTILHTRLGVLEGQYILAPFCGLWLVLASLIIEFQTMWHEQAFKIVLDNVWLFILASMLGLAVNLMSFLIIQQTSSLTFKIIGTVRNTILIVIGIGFYNELITFHQGLGYATALIGFLSYNLVEAKMLDFSQMFNVIGMNHQTTPQIGTTSSKFKHASPSPRPPQLVSPDPTLSDNIEANDGFIISTPNSQN